MRTTTDGHGCVNGLKWAHNGLSAQGWRTKHGKDCRHRDGSYQCAEDCQHRTGIKGTPSTPRTASTGMGHMSTPRIVSAEKASGAHQARQGMPA
eukprot:1158108-Pelagomonas_calceolata.AAC.14